MAQNKLPVATFPAKNAEPQSTEPFVDTQRRITPNWRRWTEFVDTALRRMIKLFTFLALEDTPDSYSGQTLKGVRVKADESGLEFFTIPSTIGDVTGPASAVDSDFATFNGTTGKIIKDSGWSRDTDGTLAANSDSKIPSQKAVKTYADAGNAAAVASAQAYTDAKVAGISWKTAVRAATTANGTLSTAFANGQVIDGVTLATGDRILVKNQSTASQNGIYVVAASGAPARATDADAGSELVNATCYVSEGTTLADTQWTCTTNAPITPGSTALAFAQLSAGSGSAASTTDILTGTDTTKFATADAIAALWEKGADVASGATTTLGEGGFFHITGTTTITAFAFAIDKSGRPAWLKFDGILTLTHNATSLILPSGANITTAVGDCATVVSEGSGNFRVVTYTRADGTAIALANSGASAGSYGSGTLIPVVTVDAKGRVTSISTTPATGGGGGGTGLYSQVLSATPTKSGTGLTSTLGSGTTVTDTTVGVNFDATGANAGMITSSVPATPYSITALLTVNNSSQYSVPAIGWSDGTKVHFIYSEFSNSHVTILGFSNISTFASTSQQNTSRYGGGRLYWWKIRDDGTTIYFYSSGDGLNWGLEYSVAKASAYLGSSGYTKLFAGCPGGSGAVNITVASWTQGV